MDECEWAPAAEPEAKEPFAHLPRSTFVLGESKCKYSDEDTLSVVLPYFWEHFDEEGFPKELTQTFMSCNLTTGMFQRCTSCSRMPLPVSSSLEPTIASPCLDPGSSKARNLSSL